MIRRLQSCWYFRVRYPIEHRRACQAVIEAAKAACVPFEPYDDTELARLRRAVKELRYLEGQSGGRH